MEYYDNVLNQWSDENDVFYTTDFFEEFGVPPNGCEWNVQLGSDELNCRIIMSDACSWEVVGLGVKQDSYAHAGYQGTVSGLLMKVRNDVDMMRDGYSVDMQASIDSFLLTIDETIRGIRKADRCRLLLRDPSGLSSFQDMSQHATKSLFTRSYLENEALGVYPDELPVINPDDVISTPEGLAALLRDARNVVCFSGAGISVESGIPPFRSTGSYAQATTSSESKTRDVSAGSIWGEFDASKMTVQGFNASEDVATAWWTMKHSLLPKFNTAHANAAHEFFGYLQSTGQLLGVVTQNIDSLHQSGGVSAERVLELHGHMRGLICSNNAASIFNPIPYGDGLCTFVLPEAAARQVEYFPHECIPRCPLCNSPLRTETVMFGQPLPLGYFTKAVDMTQAADVFIVVGSSLVVTPANELPKVALRSGAKLVMINLDDTQYDEYATALVRAPAGEFLARVREILSGSV